VTTYNIVATTNDATVVAEYISKAKQETEYQSEEALEKDLITRLCGQGYEYVNISGEAGLIANLRKQLEMLNRFTFSDSEWNRFFAQKLAAANEGIVEKTRKIQEDHVQVLTRDDSTTKNVMILDKKHIHNNRLQVINQYEEKTGVRKSRYDVTILVNGLPLVHIELKRRGLPIREAFNQINRYQRDSFWAASGLFEYIQIFVISNGTNTKYYSNTTRDQHIKESNDINKAKQTKTSNSFKFTTNWADSRNEPICDITDFTKTFFAKHTLLNILTRYCVFTSEQTLMVMRPYQIVATERILNRIEIANNYKKMGTLAAGGYIWHTTGSGKTLTSFKTAQLATELPYIHKVLFVVDRKDLDYQTMKEYDRFEKGAANGNTSTKILQTQLENPSAKIIVTTIQKLDYFVRKNKAHDVYKQHVVLIFDECHRSQFGTMHKNIVKAFKNYHIFGFTGTPIFAVNASDGNNGILHTTEQAFGDKLHSYTIVDAIRDENILPFLIDYFNTIKTVKGGEEGIKSVSDAEKILSAPERIREVTSYILEHFDMKTKRDKIASLAGKRIAGFNSIFAVSSIPTAMKYYTEFKRQLDECKRKLNIAIIYSYTPNEDDPEAVFPDEKLEPDKLDQTSRDFLESAIADYNQMFSVNYDTSADRFQNYYKDVSQRVKNREIDILIVVNMFLTGFDATTLNTLWVDKNLRFHGLLQAFSRTNRILNSVKTFGNIICFRNLKHETDEAIALFGNKEAGGIVLLRTYSEYYNGYVENGKHKPGYTELISQLETKFSLNKPIVGEKAKKDFIQLFGNILKLRNILSAFDEFTGNEILSSRDFQDYQSRYIDLYQELTKEKKAEKEDTIDDIIFEMELIKQIEVNIDYILMLVAKYNATNRTDKAILEAINKAIGSSIRLRSKRELIDRFIEQLNPKASVEDEWCIFVQKSKEAEILELIKSEGLKPDETKQFIANSFRDGDLKIAGEGIDNILPPLSRFSGNTRADRKQIIIEKLAEFFEKYKGLV